MFAHLMWNPHLAFQQLQVVELSRVSRVSMEELSAKGFAFTKTFSKWEAKEELLLWNAFMDISTGKLDII